MMFIAMPFFLTQLFGQDHFQPFGKQSSWRSAVILSSLSALFCMTYPVQLTEGLPFDLSALAFAACFLYAGPLPGLAVCALMLLYRFLLGNEDSFYMQAISILLIAAWLLPSRRRLMTNACLLAPLAAAGTGLTLSALASLGSIVYLGWKGTPMSLELAGMFTMYILFHAAAAVLAVYIVKKLLNETDSGKRPQHQEKLHMMGELASSLAHELRHPMTVARGFVQMIRRGDLSDTKRQIYAQLVQDEIEKAQSMINDYLSFAKPQLDAIELLDAKQLVLRAVDSLTTFASLRQVHIAADLQDKLMISANPDKFIQCIVHLCRNGIESMPGGGTLRIIGSVQCSTVCIDIIDQGIGMTPDEVGRLGTPYYSARGKGNGLGMMVTYRAIHNIHGRIDVTSERGKGTCFTLMLPTLQPSSYH